MTHPARSFEFERVLDGEELAVVRAALDGYPGYDMIVSQPVAEGFGAGFLNRHDVVSHYLRTGGISGRPVNLRELADRTNFFRGTFAYGERVEVSGVEPYLYSARLREAAARLYGLPVVEPAMVFVNLMLPGQELGVHADVPEFCGLSRDEAPEWLMVVMHHSGLFERERVPIATAVSWFGDASGGAFFYWPDGPRADPREIPTHDNHCVVLDTDSVFHAVAPVKWRYESERPLLEIGVRVVWSAEEQRWIVTHNQRELMRLTRADVRVSLSWKARCFETEAQRDQVMGARARGEGLTLDEALTRLRLDLHQRGRLSSPDPGGDPRELIMALLETYLEFPNSLSD
ncbi:hypothetical protein ENSA5_25840 [Enhygromyxa salina]|uniref:Uncharacterized protein n=1 Tax=Enhygromyxa salina TaxID=215803 RepID=A0A2S9YAK1_9BACT|nr:hypothetical protein [Enhygromyxa salina]PRQ02125.1 hypothetical protein ENSA5_25840 [Enhygromyxa salina]